MMCKVMGKQRSAYYKRFSRDLSTKSTKSVVLELVKGIREDEPRTGTRKLHDRIKPKLSLVGVSIGRDKLFDTLREEKMLVAPKKNYQKTTYSEHNYVVSPNLYKEVVVSKPNQSFVSDITYISLREGFAYLFLVTDSHSRKIVGYHLSRELTHYSAILALGMALSAVRDSTGIIHHSDRGCQYCCHEFLNFLAGCGMVSSMTDANHCYQNAIAERVNGTLKNEFDLDATFVSFAHAREAVDRAIYVYNSKRTHWSLGLQTPEAVYAKAA